MKRRSFFRIGLSAVATIAAVSAMTGLGHAEQGIMDDKIILGSGRIKPI